MERQGEPRSSPVSNGQGIFRIRLDLKCDRVPVLSRSLCLVQSFVGLIQ
jgi:hypothetical protein